MLKMYKNFTCSRSTTTRHARAEEVHQLHMLMLKKYINYTCSKIYNNYTCMLMLKKYINYARSKIYKD